MSSGHAPENMAILRTIAVNLLRLNGCDSVTDGIWAVAPDAIAYFPFLNRLALPQNGEFGGQRISAMTDCSHCVHTVATAGKGLGVRVNS